MVAVDTQQMFELDLTKPEPLPESARDRAHELMGSGRLFRYTELAPGELSDAAQLEVKFAELLGRSYAVAVNSCGAALFLALRSAGVRPGDPVLVNAYTLAPVPGAIEHAGATPVLVEVTANCVIDLDDLAAKACVSGAKALLLSHMRGHISNMDEVVRLCDEQGITLIEDCAHTLGAGWNGKSTGTFGRAACFSLQTFKHINSGEGGVIVTDDAELAAKAILFSGSYMLYGQHGARPPESVFESLRGRIPNYSLRITALAAALALPQLDLLPARIERMNRSYRQIETRLRGIPLVVVIERDPLEDYVGSSLQFRVPSLLPEQMQAFLHMCRERGLGLKWFGETRTEGFTSRPSSWEYLTDTQLVPRSEEMLACLFDMRIPPAMTDQHCHQAATVIEEALTALLSINDATYQ